SRIFNEVKYHPSHRGVVDVMGAVTFAKKGTTIASQMADFLAFQSRRYKGQCEAARRYLPFTKLQRTVFFSVHTKTHLNFEFRTHDEIASGYADPSSWRRRESDLVWRAGAT